MPNGVIGSNVVEIASREIVLIHSLRILLSINGELLFFIGVESAFEGEFLSTSHYEMRLHLAIFPLLRHFAVGLVSVSVDELANIVKSDLATLVAEAEHERVQDV